MRTGLYINGIPNPVLEEILSGQTSGSRESFLQPHDKNPILMLRDNPPTPESPVGLYISTAENLTKICYIAEIIKWEDKQEISPARRDIILGHLKRYQPNECDLFSGVQLGNGKARNVITIRNLQLLEIWPETSWLTKKSDGLPLKKRTRSGRWSEVYDPEDLNVLKISHAETESSNAFKLAVQIQKAKNLDVNALQLRLASAPKLPEKIQIISVGYRRNADVIVAALNRADGVCERCKKNAPFLRRSDGTPFLEVHHRKTLAEGGEDTIENAMALCPNCHRELHHG